MCWIEPLLCVSLRPESSRGALQGSQACPKAKGPGEPEEPAEERTWSVHSWERQRKWNDGSRNPSCFRVPFDRQNRYKPVHFCHCPTISDNWCDISTQAWLLSLLWLIALYYCPDIAGSVRWVITLINPRQAANGDVLKCLKLDLHLMNGYFLCCWFGLWILVVIWSCPGAGRVGARNISHFIY